jgi:hypothetical protein
MPTLKAPKQVVFLVSLILSILAWITAFTDIAYIGGHPSILMTFAYIVLALGCFCNAAQVTPWGARPRATAADTRTTAAM